ncbi:MAG: ATP-dependent Lhr-like helicase [Planctomycetota bacterium]|jgi:ATP-dependent Lhr-like helicase
MAHPLRKLLPRSYQAYLGRFSAPNQVQEQAIPTILEGSDVLLCAPTASGKTEAFAAPVTERLLTEGAAPMSGLIVSPTRALANDLYRRLEGRMHELRLSFGRYTAEHKERSSGKWPAVVILTPEGLDSLLARRPKDLSRVRVIVLDEIHVIDGTPRGDQLRLLLHRLTRVADEPVQRVAASATVGKPELLAARYLHNASIVQVTGGRALSFKSFKGSGPDALGEHLTTLAHAGLKKILVFCNSRRDVENYSAAIRGNTPFEDRVYPHHGSLSKTIRERTEQQFLNAPVGVAVATMTLELGIDIGTVDYVLLSSPPSDVASLMQRIGRGGRRAKKMRVGFACEDAGREFLFRVMAKSGVRGRLHERPYVFRPSVLVQQAICLAGGRGYVTPQSLRACVPSEISDDLGDNFAEEVLASMWKSELLEPPRSGRYVLSENLEKRYDRGTVHSNFSDPPDIDVVDRLTGDVIGKLSRRLDHGNKMSLGGGARKEVLRDNSRILTDSTDKGAAASYASAGGPVTSFGLGRALASEMGAGDDEILIVPTLSAWCLLHGLGTFGGLFLADVLSRRDERIVPQGVTPYRLLVHQAPNELPLATESEIESFLVRHRARIVSLCGMGPNQRHLPETLGANAVRIATGLDEVSKFLENARLVTRSLDEKQLAALEGL